MKILVVEDNPSEAICIRKIVEAFGYGDVEIAVDAAQAWDMIGAGGFRVILSDWMMPGGDGLSLCKRVRSTNLPFYAYIIMLTSRHERGDILEALSSGADDFLVKPVDPDALHVRLQVAQRIVNLENRLRRANEALREYAADLHQRSKIDGLMRISNRTAFEARLREVHNWAITSGRVFSVVMCDVDRFKSYNDSFGHQRGDEILRKIAEAVTGVVRATDRTFRYGGEEIALLLPGVEIVEAANVAERVRRSVAEIRFEGPDGSPFHVTISCGVATFPQQARGEDDCLGPLEHADRALYEAKRLGRNRVVRADEVAGLAPWPGASFGAAEGSPPIQ